MEKMLIDVDEAAGLLNLTRAKVYQLVKIGELQSVRVGKSLRIPLAALQVWLEHKLQPPARDD